MPAKKIRSQMILAVATVLLALIVATASTFAWFAANTHVEATGMDVHAQADSMFLQIKGTGGTATVGTVAGDGNDFNTIGAVEMTGVRVYPTAHKSEMTTIADVKAADTGDAAKSKYWYYGYSATSDNYEMLGSTETKVPLADFNYYVAEATYQVRVQEGTGLSEVYDLYVKSITLPANTGISAIVAGTDRFQEFTASGANGSPVSLSDTVSTTAQTVTVYLFIDGNNASVYTNNIEALLGDIELSLSCYETDAL